MMYYLNKIDYKINVVLNSWLVNLKIKKYNTIKVNLKNIYDDDIFIVSYPKSGNTWLRFLIANLSEPNQEITFRNIENYVPDIYKSRDYINKLQLRPRFIKTHDSQYECYPKIIYIYRDGRDVAVSYYYYLTGRGEFNGTFTEFLKDNPSWGAVGWTNHISKALEYGKNHPDLVFFIKYEEMLQDTFDVVYRLSKFCGLSNTKKEVEKAIHNCQFHQLKVIENKYGGEDSNHNYKFFRSGTSQQWMTMFSENDLQEYMSTAKNCLKRLNYL